MRDLEKELAQSRLPDLLLGLVADGAGHLIRLFKELAAEEERMKVEEPGAYAELMKLKGQDL